MTRWATVQGLRFTGSDSSTRWAATACGLTLLIAATAAASTTPTATPPLMEVRYTATFSAGDLTFTQRHGYDVVRLADFGQLTDVGRPALPVQTVRVAVPAGMAVSGVRLGRVQTTDLPGRYTVYPAQPSRPCSGPNPNDFIGPDAAVYSVAAAYPATPVTFGHQTDLVGQSMAVIEICPLEYMPAEGRLRLHTEMEIVIDGTDGHTCRDYLPEHASPRTRDAYARSLRDMVVNPDAVSVMASPRPGLRSRGVDPGTYDYVIITQGIWADAFQPLADWKTRKGVPATIVTKDWIYFSGGYSGDEDERIRAFVQDAHDTWGATYFLLGGDTNVIPANVRTMQVTGHDPDDIPNDTYYADYDDDWTCEVHVGRAPARTEAQVTTFVNKTLTYETDPPMSNYARTAAFFGFDLYGAGSDEGRDCKRSIQETYLPETWTYRREYDSESGDHLDDVIEYLNQGNNLVNHIDHSSTHSMGAGSINHGDSLYNDDMAGLSNGDYQSILYSIGCWACDFDAGTCIAEAFVRNSGGGGIAFIGNSRYGWYSPGTSDYASLRYDRRFFRSLFEQDHFRLGDCFTDHKHDAYQSNSTYRYIFVELTLLGDPELAIWTQNPHALEVSHDAEVATSQFTTFPVTVYRTGLPLQDATVCLWKEGDVYATSQTDYTGVATFAITPAGVGVMYVTAVARNSVPYLGSVQVEGETCSDGIQNQGEDRIDCGGPCPPCECISDATCDDGLFCTGAEACDDYGNCQTSPAVDCDDLISCTDDACNEETDRCDNIPNHGFCDDGQYCNGAEVCNPDVGCEAGEPVDCDDGIECTVDLCYEPTQSCLRIADDTACDDGQFCTGTESCDPEFGCLSSGDPCSADAWCNEDSDTCDPYGDEDADGDVDLADFARFQSCFGQSAPGPCSPADMTGDAAVDFDDLALFIAALEASGPL